MKKQVIATLIAVMFCGFISLEVKAFYMPSGDDCSTSCGETNISYDCVITHSDGTKTTCENRRKKREQ
jgi:hypothetical protein